MKDHLLAPLMRPRDRLLDPPLVSLLLLCFDRGLWVPVAYGAVRALWDLRAAQALDQLQASPCLTEFQQARAVLDWSLRKSWPGLLACLVCGPWAVPALLVSLYFTSGLGQMLVRRRSTGLLVVLVPVLGLAIDQPALLWLAGLLGGSLTLAALSTQEQPGPVSGPRACRPMQGEDAILARESMRRPSGHLATVVMVAALLVWVLDHLSPTGVELLQAGLWASAGFTVLQTVRAAMAAAGATDDQQPEQLTLLLSSGLSPRQIVDGWVRVAAWPRMREALLVGPLLALPMYEGFYRWSSRALLTECNLQGLAMVDSPGELSLTIAVFWLALVSMPLFSTYVTLAQGSCGWLVLLPVVALVTGWTTPVLALAALPPLRTLAIGRFDPLGWANWP
ncbi:MAG: hypothetical protein KC910_27795 [Candidatus Eremiobacteraeota bacterium]|nr:hypothetical protein [Candidatus Eremiobacteraeota bacterium]